MADKKDKKAKAPKASETPAEQPEATPDAPAEEASSEAPVEEAASEAPAEEASSDAPAEEASSDAPAEEAASDAPAKEAASDAPAEEASSDAPAEEASSDAPAEEAASDAPAKEAASDAPAKEAAPEAPAKEAASDAPAEAAPEAPAEPIRDLADLGAATGLADPAAADGDTANAPAVAKIDAQGRAYATGKRKNAVARVWIKPGAGRIVVNGRDIETYFARPVLRMVINQPFAAVNRENQYDVMCTVKGGGLSGQAGAVRYGISKALIGFEPTLRPTLKSGGFLTRDARVVERKKYGKAKARRSFQFSKR